MPVLLGGEVIVVVCVIISPPLEAPVPPSIEVVRTELYAVAFKLLAAVISPDAVVPGATGEVG